MHKFLSDALESVGGIVKSLTIDHALKYYSYIKNCGQNLDTLRGKLEILHVKRHVIDREVMRGKEKLKIITGDTALWLESVQEFTRDEDLKELMIKDLKIAKVAFILMQDDLKSLIESNGKIRDLVVELMEDITQRKELVGTGENLSEEDIGVAKVLEKLLKENFEDFKELMKTDKKMVVAARQLLEDLEDFDKLLKEDKEMAIIVEGARGISLEQELLQMNENSFRSAVRSFINPVGELMVNEGLMKSLPENVRLGIVVMGVVIGNNEGLMADVVAETDTLRRSNCRCGCASFVDHLRDRHDMSVAAENMINKIRLIIGDIPARPLTRPLARAELEAIPTYSVGLESRKVLLQNIVVALTDANVNSVAVHGMGGSGKTTLAKEIANNKAHGAFHRVVMVEISETLNIERIQDQIGTGLGLSLDGVHGIPQKAILLYNRLKSEGNKNDNKCKKTLLILDNIWHGFDLIEVGIPREYCKIFLTSRERNVCKRMDVEDANIFNVGLLNKIEAKYLFQNQVRRHVDSGEFKSVVDRLLEKCGGLPLSIVTTAKSLKGKNLPLWLKFVKELEKPISGQVRGALRETFEILRTSYEVIDSEEKKNFFLLACLYPLGSRISIVDLMRYGIGLDLFQHANKLSEAVEQAYKWADELVSSSMLLEGDSKEYIKIHDVIRECIISFASKGDLKKGGHMFLVDAISRWSSDEIFNQLTGISLLSGTDYSRLRGVKAELLHILLLKGNVNCKSPDSNFFQGMTNLKVLKMSAMNFEEGLPESMGKLKGLKTLHLEDCKLRDIKLIGKLEYLLVLSLRGSRLEGIPDDIGMLSKLRSLDMGRCTCELSKIPANVIDRLSHLEGLYLLESSFREEANSDGLNKLDYLNILEMRVRDTSQLTSEAQFVEKLDKFEIHVGPLESGMYPMEFEQSFGAYILLRYQLPERVVMIEGVDASGNWSNNWLKKVIKKAEYLKLEKLSIKNVVPEVAEERFRDLRYLYLIHMDQLQRICDGTAPSGLFSNLLHLNVFNLKQLLELLHVNLLPRKLITLYIGVCNSLRFLFSENNNASLQSNMDNIELPYLESLKLINVQSVISVAKLSCIDDTEDQCFFNTKVRFPSLKSLELQYNRGIVKLWGNKSNIHSFRNLKQIRLISCTGLKSLGPPSIFTALVQLFKLEISDCKEMQEVISKVTGEQGISEEIITFPKLKYLFISNCSKLKCFYENSTTEILAESEHPTPTIAFFHKEMRFPCLEEFEVTNISDAATVLWDWDWHASLADKEGGGITFNPVPELRKLTIDKLEGGMVVTQNLSCLIVGLLCGKVIVFSGSQKEESVWAYSQLPKLEELYVENCEPLIQLFEDEDEPSSAMLNFCGQLRHLELSYLRNLKRMRTLHPFQSLCRLCIRGLNWKYVFSADWGLEQLQSLEEIEVSDCKKLEAVIKIGEEHETVLFPSLKKLTLDELKHVRKFSSSPDASLRFPSLEILEVRWCKRLDALWTGAFSAPKLHQVHLRRCDMLQWFISGQPNNVVAFPFLRTISIWSCGAMKSFSSEPLMTPQLRNVYIIGCREMEWFFYGNSNHGADLELPSLEVVKIDSVSYPIPEIGDLNQFLKTRYASNLNKRSEESEEDVTDDSEESEEDMTDGGDSEEGEEDSMTSGGDGEESEEDMTDGGDMKRRKKTQMED